jgi:hypothetical protein
MLTYAQWPYLYYCLRHMELVRAASGTHFTCFNSTKVQIVTGEEVSSLRRDIPCTYLTHLSGMTHPFYISGGAWRDIKASYAQALGAPSACFTSTKVKIVTGECQATAPPRTRALSLPSGPKLKLDESRADWSLSLSFSPAPSLSRARALSRTRSLSRTLCARCHSLALAAFMCWAHTPTVRARVYHPALTGFHVLGAEGDSLCACLPYLLSPLCSPLRLSPSLPLSSFPPLFCSPLLAPSFC